MVSDKHTEPVLQEIVRRVVEAFHPLRIILFGSAARGESKPDSDVDILVVMPNGTKRLETTQALHLGLFGIPVSVDFLVATPADLEKHRENIGLIYKTILREGKELYASA
jgi:uncharacterized protein